MSAGSGLPTVSELLDAHPIGARQRMLVALIMTLLVVDGVDVQLLALVAPKIMAEFKIGAAAFAPALTAALIGTACGNFGGGWLGDRGGRKRVLVSATFIFAIATLLIGFSRDLPGIVILRLIAGFGFGAAVPNGLAHCSEWLPHRARTGAMSLLAPAVPLGGVIGALSVVAVLTWADWRKCFVLFGGCSLIIAVIALVWLPESPARLIGIGRSDVALRVIKRMLGGSANLPASCERDATASSKRSVFSADLLRMNVGFSLTLLLASIVTWSFMGWTTTAFVSAGLPFPIAIRSVFVFNLFAVACSFALVWPLKRFGSLRVLTALSLGCATLFLSLAFSIRMWVASPSTVAQLVPVVISALLGGVLGASMTTIYAIGAAGYPPEKRASGIGLGLMFGRIGGMMILGSGGLLLEASGKAHSLFYVTIALTALSTCFGAVIIDRHIRPSNAR